MRTVEDRLTELERLTDKLRFQLELALDDGAIPRNTHASLVIAFNWSQDDLTTAVDVFDRNEDVKNGHQNLERELRRDLGLSYQSVKMVVATLYANGQFEPLCRDYMRANRCVEFDTIGAY